MPERTVVDLEAWVAERGRCARPGCPNRTATGDDESERLCAGCALEHELFDRDARWEGCAVSLA